MGVRGGEGSEGERSVKRRVVMRDKKSGGKMRTRDEGGDKRREEEEMKESIYTYIQTRTYKHHNYLCCPPRMSITMGDLNSIFHIEYTH